MFDLHPRLRAAAAVFRDWVVEADARAHGEFWPQEQTMQDWFAAALVQSQFCRHPTEVLAEVGLGEEEDLGPMRTAVQRGAASSCFLYDLVVLHDRPANMGRSFATCAVPGIRTAIQIKSLNSAGTMGRQDLLTDLRTLAVASAYQRSQNQPLETLFLVVATSCKDARGERARARIDWLRSRFAEFTTNDQSDAPSGVPMVLVLADEISVGLSTGRWRVPA